MTKEELHQQIKQITDTFGVPQWDMFDPLNESARRIKEIRTQFKLAAIKAARDKKKAEGLKDIAESIKEEKNTGYKQSLPIYIDKKDLVAFSLKEQEILISHFENLTLSPKELANRFATSHQSITAMFHSAAYKILYTKVFDKVLPIESLISIRQAMKDGDSKVSIRVAEHYNLLKNEQKDMNILSKPIEDPKAIQMLKEIGDKLVSNSNTDGNESKSNKDVA